MKARKRMSIWCLILGAAITLLVPVTVKASSGMIQFTTKNAQVRKGEVFTVVCTVTSPDSFLDTEFTVGYNPDLMQFIRGGKKVSGGGGELKIASVGNTVGTNKKTFSLQFAALRKGAGIVAVEGDVQVLDEGGNAFSMSSNRLSIAVVKKGTTAAPKPTPVPLVTPAPVLSANNRLRDLKLSALDMSPAFSADITKYTATVDCDTNVLYFSFVPEDDRTRVRIEGNEDLKTGINQVQVVAVAENGAENRYVIQVTKETDRETRERQKKGEETKDVTFGITREKDMIRLRNAYDFEVLPVSSLKEIPAGYIESSIEMEGITIPAFTMENDLDNNYLLLYLKGPSGESGIYQFDREEKTLQKYTGNMIEKVNKGAGQTQKEETDFSQGQLLWGVIIGLVIVVLCLLIAMLKMAIEKRKEHP